ncbi:hypothetical protein CO026_02950 [Candidatus Kaiserbacteria bacterium CG_4_9_14_0_2_um_filter_41_32]|uniref:Type II secretion system protein GspG C-terminal domain-containing protein n=1 Tax=Candidatus Kaiserbacteria bacterium CG_4_9_14_0_2_um_filter_41_32 TaxID=1974601 RepID=A0A2M8FE82_9BACT|nr:MAG: hypothetical protein CO026_02950 [Candidatus Kaiserbacteria bacterium CG_4_9_14_0_2_um_filter_41_32]
MRRFIHQRGFTLIELLVTIAVIGILASIVYSNLSSTGGVGRDAKRKADLRNMQSAIEQYKNKKGVYPSEGCVVGSDGFSGENDCLAYISGLAPEFISVLPHDPKRLTNVGYAYTTNSAGTVYKLMAVGTVESETVTSDSEFKSCDTSGICPTSGSGVCSPSNSRYQKSYAVWGGYADGANDAAVKTNTAQVICK